jgi:glycerol-3-phosphate dehydrogenase
LRLVREALIEREVLLRLAPHVVRPMRFLLPAQGGMRSVLLLRLGLFIYDHLGGRRYLPPVRNIDLTHHAIGMPLRRRYKSGFQYSDCMVDDARLVVLNAVDAAERGAVIRTRTKCVWAERDENWRLVLNARGRRDGVTARALINAAGPWVGQVAETILRLPGPSRVRLVKGSHIVVRRLFEHDCGYIFQNPDKRVVFALPFERDFTLIGTTDEEFRGDPAGAAPQPHEVAYLCETLNKYFRQPVEVEQVVWAFSGVRSLYDDGAEKPEDITREYYIDLAEGFHRAPLLTIYGGKITTYRRLAEAVLSRLSHFFAARDNAWTKTAPLPGGDFAFDAIEGLVTQARSSWPFLSEDHARRLVHAYGTRIDRVLGKAQNLADLGACFGADLTAAELRYLVTHEWAQDSEDVLWRRSKLGLRFSADERAALSRFMVGARDLNAAE